MAVQEQTPAALITAARRAAEGGNQRNTAPTVVIQPSRGLAALNLRDLWRYRDLLGGDDLARDVRYPAAGQAA